MIVLVLAAALVIGGVAADGWAASTASPKDPVVRAVSQNILHGIACPEASDRCRLGDRVALFARQLGDAGCPQLVGVQEADQRIVDAIRRPLRGVCRGRYRIVWDRDPGLDREVVFTTLPVLGSRRVRLAGPLRTMLWVRVASDVGAVEFATTHLASSSDDRPCDTSTCPAPCEVSDTLNTCQARQALRYVARHRVRDDVVIFGGDLNAKPGEPTIAAIEDAGYSDTHLAAGKVECDPSSGAHCTSGRIDDSLTDLEDPASRQVERIDYLWLSTRRRCDLRKPTGLFNAKPASTSGGLAFPSDHTAVTATISCRTTTSQRATARRATVPRARTTTTTSGSIDTTTTAEITRAFETVFDGDVTDVAAKLAALEDADRLRDFFVDTYAKTRAVASRIRVRIDGARVVDATHTDVTYTLLLDGTPVLDHLPGAAVRIDGRWLVTRRTFCDVSTQGSSVIPDACR